MILSEVLKNENLRKSILVIRETKKPRGKKKYITGMRNERKKGKKEGEGGGLGKKQRERRKVKLAQSI